MFPDVTTGWHVRTFPSPLKVNWIVIALEKRNYGSYFVFYNWPSVFLVCVLTHNALQLTFFFLRFLFCSFSCIWTDQQKFFASFPLAVSVDTCDQYCIFNFLHVLMIFDMNYGFVHFLIKWGTKIQKCFKTAMALSKRKVTYILASELINK